MKHISVGLVVYVDDEIAANHEALIAYLEGEIFAGDLAGSIVTTSDISEEVRARIQQIKERMK
jgi:hypothetical protein